MDRYVEITFDCLPLRSIGRLDVPMDASPRFLEKADRIKRAMDKHGRHNTYFLHNATCVFRLTNDPAMGILEFRFEGTAQARPARNSLQSAGVGVSRSYSFPCLPTLV